MNVITGYHYKQKIVKHAKHPKDIDTDLTT